MHLKLLGTTKGLILVREILRLWQFIVKVRLILICPVWTWLALAELGCLGKSDGIFSNDTLLH